MVGSGASAEPLPAPAGIGPTPEGAVSASRAPRRNIEHEEQALLFAWCQLAALRIPELRLLYAVPNFARLPNARAGAWRKAEGLKSGVPDLHLPVPRGGHPGLWIEMKSPTGRPTKDQLRWMEALRAEGHQVHLCRSWMEARRILEQYLSLPKPADSWH